MSDTPQQKPQAADYKPVGDNKHGGEHPNLSAWDFLGESFYNATADWMRGGSQVTNRLFGTDWHAPQKYDLPEPQTATQWLAKNVGAGLGMVAPFVATELATKALGALRILPKLTGATKAAVDGGFYGMLFTPSDDPNKNFGLQRLEASITGAATFGTQRYLFNGMAGSLGLLDNKLVAKSWSELAAHGAARVGVNVVGGLGAGFTNTETSSVLAGNGLVFDGRLVDNMAGFAATGLALDALHTTGGKLADTVTNSRTYTRTTGAMKAGLAKGVNGLADAFDNLNSKLATPFVPRLTPAYSMAGAFGIRPGDNIVLNTAANDSSGGSGTTGGATRRPFQNAGGAQRLADLESARPDVMATLIRADAPRNQDSVYKALNKFISEPIATDHGSRILANEGWRIYATVPFTARSGKGSGLDAVGADYLMVNVNSRGVHFLDASSDAGKGTQSRPVPQIRKPGVIHFEPHFFDYGRIDPDTAYDWVPNVQQQLVQLADSRAPFNLDTTPLPDFRAISRAELLQQVNVFIDWLNKQDGTLYKQYAQDLSGTVYYAKGAAGNFRSEKFEQNAVVAAERAIVLWLAGRGSRPPAPITDAGLSERQSDVAVVPNEVQKTRRIAMRTSDDRQTQVDVRVLMESARALLIRDLGMSDRDLDRAPGQQAKRVRTLRRILNDAGVPVDSALRRLTTERAAIEAGGSTNFDARPEIAITTRRLLERRTEAALLGETENKPPPQANKPSEKRKPEPKRDATTEGLEKAAPALHELSIGLGAAIKSSDDLVAALSLLNESGFNAWTKEEQQAIERLIDDYNSGDQNALRAVQDLAASMDKPK